MKQESKISVDIEEILAHLGIDIQKFQTQDHSGSTPSTPKNAQPLQKQ
ncbi:hypothetical protein J2X61_000369 [Bacillus sp. 3255]|nr:hypothetical protein [Bacillus sp. 3255]